MKIKSVIDTIVSAISNDTEINDYCQAHFDGNPKIIVGIDLKNPPVIEDYPSIIIYDVKTEREVSRIKYWVSIGVGVANNDITTVDKVTTHDVFIEGLELKELIESLLAITFVKAKIQKAESIPIENSPIGLMSVTVCVECPLPGRNSREPV